MIAVTSAGGGREVTLGQWYHHEKTSAFGKKLIAGPRQSPQPIRLRIPTRIANPQVRAFGEQGEIEAKPTVANGMIELEIANPVCFAVEAFTGPSISLAVDDIAQPGKETTIGVTVKQI